jgi:3-hydroxyisobutyrate dehydrogenase-like beta-hydroxyacid dehydrogenase
VTSDKQRIGFIGVGMMGHGMAKNLVTKGFPLTVLGHKNRKPIESLKGMGATEATNPAEVSNNSDIIFICVVGSPQVEEVVFGKNGLLSSVKPGQIVVDCSTSEPESTARIADEFSFKRVAFVDAPLARTPKEAEEGRLNVMVGAELEIFKKIEPALKTFGENIFHVGGPGAGHKLKLVNNFFAMGQAALIAESLVAAKRSGIDLDAYCKVVSAGGANSGIFQMVGLSAVAGTYDGLRFGLDLARKDLRYYTHMTEQLGLPSVLGEAVHQSFVLASALGYGDKLVGSLVEAQEKITRTKVGKS